MVYLYCYYDLHLIVSTTKSGTIHIFSILGNEKISTKYLTVYNHHHSSLYNCRGALWKEFGLL